MKLAIIITLYWFFRDFIFPGGGFFGFIQIINYIFLPNFEDPIMYVLVNLVG